MTVVYHGNNLYSGLTADTKPTTNVATNSWYFDTQLRTLYSYNGSSWDGFAGGSGEANTASNVGAGQGVWKAKTGVDLSFRSLTATSSKIALANNTNDIGIDVTEANLTLSNMTGPLSVAKGGTGAATLTGVISGNGTSAVTASNTLSGITFTDQGFKLRNPAATQTLTWVNPIITASQNHYMNEPYMFIIFKVGSTYFCQNGDTGGVEISNAEPATVFQYALTNAAGIGRIFVKDGTYTFNALGDGALTDRCLTIPSNTTIEGESMYNTKLVNGASNSTIKFFMNSVQALPGNTKIIMRNLFIDNTASTTQKTAIEMIRISDSTFDNLWIKQGANTRFGFFIQGGRDLTSGATIKPIDYWADHIRITNCVFESHASCGYDSLSGGIMSNSLISKCFGITGPAASASIAQRNLRYCVVDSNIISSSSSAGINIESGYESIVSNNVVHDTVESGIKSLETDTGGLPSTMQFVNNKVYNCKKGIEVEGKYHIIANNHCWMNDQQGIDLSDTDYNNVYGNICWNNGNDTGASTSNRCGIKTTFTTHATNYYDNANPDWTFDGTTSFAYSYVGKNNIHNNICFDNRSSKTQLYGIVQGSSTNNQYIRWNNIEGNSTAAMLNTGGANSIVKFNIGWVTENSGSSTQSGNGTTTAFNIAHGLAAAPTYYTALPAAVDTLGNYYLTADATNITVTYGIAPPSGSSNLIWKWKGEV